MLRIPVTSIYYFEFQVLFHIIQVRKRSRLHKNFSLFFLFLFNESIYSMPAIKLLYK